MSLKEKLSVNIGNATLYVEIYHKVDPITNVIITKGWKLGDTTWDILPEQDTILREFVYTGSKENNGWELANPSFFTNICSNFFNDIHEASRYVVRILNNDPSFNEEKYLALEKTHVKTIN